MPITDDEQRRAYFRDYMRRRRAASAPANDELARRIREALARCERAQEAMAESNRELVALLVADYNKLLADFNELVDDYNALLDELDK
jgi:hypothetical protein